MKQFWLKYNLKMKLCCWGIGLLFVLCSTPAFGRGSCKLSELSKLGKKIFRYGAIHKKYNTIYKACRISNGGTIWALNIQTCDVVRIKEAEMKPKVRRKGTRPEQKAKRRKAEEAFERTHPEIPYCSKI